MKNTFYLVAFAACFGLTSNAQSINKQIAKATKKKTQLGIKAGYNWSYLTGSKDGFKPDNQTGFMAGSDLLISYPVRKPV